MANPYLDRPPSWSFSFDGFPPALSPPPLSTPPASPSKPSSPPSVPPNLPPPPRRPLPSKPASRPPVPHERVSLEEYTKISNAIQREDLAYLKPLVMEPGRPRRVNLSDDPLLHVLVASKKHDLVSTLVKAMPPENLEAVNSMGDAALHVAVTAGDVEAAGAMIERNAKLVHLRNNQNEIPLHKAALYGESYIFWELVSRGSDTNARREDGATILHCAVMGNAPKLALEIAVRYPHLMTSRNEGAVTPLQLVVTIPQAFRSSLRLGPLQSLVYNCIPLEESTSDSERCGGDDDREVGEATTPTILKLDSNDDDRRKFATMFGKRCPIDCSRSSSLSAVICIPVRWIGLLVFSILRQVCPPVERLERKKRKHKQAMKLIAHLAADPQYWEFIDKGRTPDGSDQRPAKKKSRWDESPLTLGAEMGLHEFVEMILQVFPKSALYLDSEGRNVLQVAIQHGHEKIVEIIESKATGSNPVLPSSLLSAMDGKTKNTILHLAAEGTAKGEELSPLQLQRELWWFERVRKLLPKDFQNSRNESEKTAQELFTENHKGMVRNGKSQLMEIGKTCSSLVAAVVFASSFSIPGEKDAENNPVFRHKTAFKVFSHAYVIGLSCASTALVLFLSLLTSPYSEREFRRVLPTKYFFATTSFFLALMALLLAFACNIYLSIYGGRRAETEEILLFVCELIIFPAVCLLVLLHHGSSFGIRSHLNTVWR